VTKLNDAGNALVYSTYLGGNYTDVARGIAVDSDGRAWVTGATFSSDFPHTHTIIQPGYGGYYDAFVTQINADNTALLFSTFLGDSGLDHGYGIAVDSNKNVYVIGLTYSTNFPTTEGAFDTTKSSASDSDAFVVKINVKIDASYDLAYSTFLGGRFDDQGNANQFSSCLASLSSWGISSARQAKNGRAWSALPEICSR
jgi:hypothetical protein